MLGLWLYTVRVRKTTCNPNCICFATSNYKLWWIIRDLQLLLSYWCPCNHEANESIQGKKGITGKGDWCLGSRWTIRCDYSYVGATGIVLCVWGEAVGHVSLKIMLWALEIFLWYATSGDFVLSSCHDFIIISVISSMYISSLVVLNGWRRRRHGAF